MRIFIAIAALFIMFLMSAVGLMAADSDSLDIYLKKAGSAFASNDYPAALELFQKALDCDSLNVNALRNLGVIYSMRKEHQKSLGYFQRALELDTTDSELYNSLGIAYLNLGDTTKAINGYRRAVALDSNNLDYLHNMGSLCVTTGKHSEAKKYLEKMIGIDSTDSEAHFLMGNIYMARQDYAGSEKYFDIAAERGPDRPRYLYYQAVAKDRLKKRDDAEKIYLKALELHPDYFDARQRLGVLYVVEQKFPEALEQFKEAARIRPDDDDTQVFLGAVYMYNNMPEESEKIYDSLVVRNPQAAQKMLNLIGPPEG